MEHRVKIVGKGHFPSVSPEFIFDMNLISFSDMKTIYAHFNLPVKDSITSIQQLFKSFEPEVNEFVKRMSVISALISHSCLLPGTVEIQDFWKYDFYCYTAFNESVSFELEFTSGCTETGIEGMLLEDIIRENELVELSPVFGKYPFIKSTV